MTWEPEIFLRLRFCVLGEFAMREGADRDDVDSGFFSKQVQGLCGGRLRSRDRDTSEAAKTNRVGWPEVEIALRQKNTGAGFGDEWRRVGKAAKSGIELKAVASCEPDAGNAFVREVIEKGGEAQEWFARQGDKVVDGRVDDGGGRTHAREDCSGN